MAKLTFIAEFIFWALLIITLYKIDLSSYLLGLLINL